MLGNTEGRRKKGLWRMKWLDGITESLSKLQGIVKDREAWHAAVHEVTESGTTEWLNNNIRTHINSKNNPRSPLSL